MSRFSIGDRVVYDGLIAKVYNIDKVAGTDDDLYSLEAEEDCEMTCCVTEEGIELYSGQELDQDRRLADARFNSAIIAHSVDRLTDKYIGCC